jgi:hypothetical protein
VRGDGRDAEVLGKEFLVFRRRRERPALIGNPDDGEEVFRRDSARALPTFENAGTTERTIPVCDWSRSEISCVSCRSIRGEFATASRPTRRFHRAETTSRRVKRDVEPSLHLPQHRGGAGKSQRTAGSHAERRRSMLWLIILLVLLFGGGGGYYGYSRWGTGGGLGIVGTVLLVVVVLYLVGGVR